MGVGPRPKPLVQPVTKTGDTGHLLPGQRIDFNSLPIPKGYVPGVGRGAAGFVTRSDIGSVRTAPGAPLAQGPGPSTAPGAPPPGSTLAAPASASAPVPYDKFLGDDAGALVNNAPPSDADDVEADAIWDAIDARMDDRRRGGTTAGATGKKRPAEEEAASETSNNNIADGFADLKRGLASVTEAEWEAIPEIGDYTIKKAKRETWAPVPDTLLAKAAQEMASASTTVVEESSSSAAAAGGGATPSLAPGGSLTAVGEGRRTVVSLKLDSAADSVSGQTVVDPRGYLTSLSSSQLSTTADVGDIKKARTLLRSVTATNPRHAPGWVAAARLEEVAGKLADARALAARGCELCPRSEDVWLEASRLAANAADAKAVLARAVGALPRSVRLWLAAADLEQERAAKARVVRRALERVPASLKLWKAAVELAPNDDDARVLLARAVECCPQHVELWLALARLETREGARKVLNKARLAVPTDASIWVTAAKLEEAHENAAMVPKIIERAVKSLGANSVVIDRDAWIKDAEEAEKSGSPATARAMVAAVVSLGVEDADRERTWLADAADLSRRGSFACAREVAAAALAAFPGKTGVWRAAIAVEKAAISAACAGGGGEEEKSTSVVAEAKANVDSLLQRAVTYCPEAEVLWLMAAKERWTSGDVPSARRLLAEAFSANPDSEAIWLAAFKLEFETGEVERARAILRKARGGSGSGESGDGGSGGGGGGDTPRVWMKAAVVERRAGDAAAERKVLDEAVKRFPTFDKLHLMRGQLFERERDWSAARKCYASGLARCPRSTPLWVSAARLEEKAASEAPPSSTPSAPNGPNNPGTSRARAVLEQARLKNPGNDELWLAAVRTEARAAGLWSAAREAGVSTSGAAAAGLSGAAASLLAKALQACPNSGKLWAEAISTAPRPARRSTSVDALKKCNDDPHVVAAVASLFAADGKADKARSWFERAVRLDPDCGDHWARYYLFESGQKSGGGGGSGGTANAAQAVLSRCVSADPRHGERWTRVSKAPQNEHLKTGEVLPLVAADIANEPPP